MKKIIIIFAMILSTVSYSQTPSYLPQNGLISWFPFNGNSQDESGNDNHGTVQGSVALSTDRFGTPSSSYSFPGSANSYIDVNHNSSFSNFQEGISLSLWYKYLDYPSSSRVLQIGNTDGQQKGFQVSVNSALNQWDGYISNTNPNVILGCGLNENSVVENTWSHLVLTYNFNTGNSKLYINGDLINDNVSQDWVNNFGAVDLSNVPFNIGRKTSSASDPWKGDIDDIGIWSRPLTTQ